MEQALSVSADSRKVPLVEAWGTRSSCKQFVRQFYRSWESLTARPQGANLSI